MVRRRRASRVAADALRHFERRGFAMGTNRVNGFGIMLEGVLLALWWLA